MSQRTIQGVHCGIPRKFLSGNKKEASVLNWKNEKKRGVLVVMERERGLHSGPSPRAYIMAKVKMGTPKSF